ncbi:hypothetical protein AAY473_031451 [Plecturocebus cupreus]
MRHHARLIFILLVEVGFHHGGQAGLELPTSGDQPFSASQCGRITGMSHRVRPLSFFFETGSGCVARADSGAVRKPVHGPLISNPVANKAVQHNLRLSDSGRIYGGRGLASYPSSLCCSAAAHSPSSRVELFEGRGISEEGPRASPFVGLGHYMGESGAAATLEGPAEPAFLSWTSGKAAASRRNLAWVLQLLSPCLYSQELESSTFQLIYNPLAERGLTLSLVLESSGMTIVHCSLDFLGSSNPPSSASQVARIAGGHHCPWLTFFEMESCSIAQARGQ